MKEKKQALCELCGEPLPEGEEMFRYHGYSGNCPKLPKVKEEMCRLDELIRDKATCSTCKNAVPFDKAIIVCGIHNTTFSNTSLCDNYRLRTKATKQI